MFGPPHGRWERRAVWLWLMTSGAAAAAMAWGVFWWWIVFIVPIPFVFAAYFAPTLWLYLTPALLIWLVLRRWPRTAALTVAVAVATIAVVVPAVLNRQLEDRVHRTAASDRGGPVSLGTTGGAVAWLDGDGDQDYCSYACLRFLITGRAQAVLIGPALQGAPQPDREYLRLRLVPWSDDRGCPLPDGVEKMVPVKDLSLIDPDQCVAFDRAPLRAARLIFNQQRSSNTSDERWPGLHVDWRRYEAYGWRDRQPLLLMRRTDASARPLGTPLMLWPSQGADTSTPAQWDAYGLEFQAGSRLDVDPVTMVAERLFVPAFDTPR